MKLLKIRIALLLINAGMALLPEGYSNKSFIENCFLTGKIKRHDTPPH